MAKRLRNDERAFIIKQLTLGLTYAEVMEAFEKKFEHTVSKMTLVRVRAQSVDQITQGRSIIATEAATSSVLLRQKSNQLLERRLDDALEDSNKFRELRLKLQTGRISLVQYKKDVEHLERLTINELTKVSEAMHNQSKTDKDDPVSPHDQAALAALIAGIQSGNPVNLVQVITSRATES